MRTDYLLIIAVIFISGCVQPQAVGGGLMVKLQADPRTVFASGALRLNVDLDNQNPRQINDVLFDVFDTGLLKEIVSPENPPCRLDVGTMRANEFKTFFCMLAAPGSDVILKDKISTEIHANVFYETDFPSVQVIGMMTEDEYLRRLSSGQLETKPAKYSYTDKNIELDVEFSENLPIVVRPGKEYFVHFTVRNIGNGFVRELGQGDFSLSSIRPRAPDIPIVECPDFEERPSFEGIITKSMARTIQPVGKEFPRITCRLLLPGGVTVVENYGLLIIVKYNYEVRESIKVGVVR